jgi:DNA-binding NtrC family response regulator
LRYPEVSGSYPEATASTTEVSLGKLSVLVVESDADTLREECSHLRNVGLEVVEASSRAAALHLLATRSFSLVLVDHFLAGPRGLELVREIHTEYPGLPIVVVSRSGGLPRAMEAMRAGAAYCLHWPFDPVEVGLALQATLEGHRIKCQPVPPGDAASALPIPEIIGASANTTRVRGLVRSAALSMSSVLVHGPSGTGKEVVTRAIHHHSQRRNQPFMAVNCGALPEGLAESELFGAEKGAYTGSVSHRGGLVRAADGGTLFLDEFTEMTLTTQVKLLRLLQERRVRTVGGTEHRSVDIRVIAATNRDPLQAIREGKLREDLYYRLAVLQIEVLPLAARPDDIAPLCEHILARLDQDFGRGPTRLTSSALRGLEAYSWPGNVRELENVLEGIFALRQTDGFIDSKDLPPRLERDQGLPSTMKGTRGDSSRVTTLRVAEHDMIRRALLRTQGNKSRAARLLGVNRPYLYRRLEEMLLEASNSTS